ncbi:hypothetical protein RRF57_013228 [Xylaria bambusicola]|uniref:J domain-containing protein n=1 Tax=Xylaria bambusicola TaxID=326684 RepID=A0AAN7UXT9_9PEZI
MTDLAQSRVPFVIPDDGGDSDEINAPTPHARGANDYQAQRERVNRILKLMAQNATLYELLDAQQDATTKEIRHAWKNIIGGIHPDKNNDTSAQQCAQAVNNARDVLCDPRKRNVYDSFIKDNPPLPEAETFGEDFAQNAYDETGSDDNDEYDDEDGEDDIEASYPRPNQQIRQLHSQMTRHIRAIFASLKG